MIRNPTWDGSFIGTIKNKDILSTMKIENGLTIKLINFYDEENWCLMKKNNDDFLIFYDELKPLFGIKKHGTNSLTIGNTNYVIGKYYDFVKLSSSEHLNYKKQICDLLIYRNILGVKDSFTFYRCNNIATELPFDKKPDINRIKSIYIKRYFSDFLDFEKRLFKILDINIKKFDDDIVFMEELLTNMTSHLKYHVIGINSIIQNVKTYYEVIK